MTIVDKDKALDLLTQALEVKGPQHTQGACYYLTADDAVYGGERPFNRYSDPENEVEPKPGCLVGTALFLLDKDALIKTVVENGFNGELITNGDFIHGLLANGIEITPEALDVFDTAQTLQDGRASGVYGNRPWGEAVAVARGDLTLNDLPLSPL